MLRPADLVRFDGDVRSGYPDHVQVNALRFKTSWLTGALALSLVANLYLVLSSVEDAPARAHAPGTVDERTPRPRRSSFAAKETFTDTELAFRLAVAESRLEELLPLELKWKRDSTRSPDLEARLRPRLDRFFQLYQCAPACFTLECHEDVCLLVVTDDAPDEWAVRFQTESETRALYSFFHFRGEGLYISVEREEDAASKELMIQVVSSIHQAPDINRCLDGASDDEELVLVASADGQAPNPSVALAIGRGPIADCVLTGAQHVMRSISVPSGVRLPEIQIPMIGPR